MALTNHKVDAWIEGHHVINRAVKLHSGAFQGSEDLSGDHCHILGRELRGASFEDGLLADQVRERCGNCFREIVEHTLGSLFAGAGGRGGEPCDVGFQLPNAMVRVLKCQFEFSGGVA